MVERCGSCKWLVANPQSLQESSCHRYPPVSHPIMAQRHATQTPMVVGNVVVFPVRSPADLGCGEHSPKLQS